MSAYYAERSADYCLSSLLMVPRQAKVSHVNLVRRVSMWLMRSLTVHYFAASMTQYHSLRTTVGFIDTPALTKHFGSPKTEGERIAPEAIANAFVYLHEQDKSCWTQGQYITASGALTCC